MDIRHLTKYPCQMSNIHGINTMHLVGLVCRGTILSKQSLLQSGLMCDISGELKRGFSKALWLNNKD